MENRDLIAACADAFGSQATVVAIDAKRRDGGGWEVFTHGGRRATGLDAVAWAADVVARGAGEILLTSMDRDGARNGYDLALLSHVTSAVGVPVIASGGAGTTGSGATRSEEPAKLPWPITDSERGARRAPAGRRSI